MKDIDKNLYQSLMLGTVGARNEQAVGSVLTLSLREVGQGKGLGSSHCLGAFHLLNLLPRTYF